VAQQGGTGEFMRDRALEALASLSINDDYFLTHIRDNLEPTLWDHGFALSPSEMRIVKDFFDETAEAEYSDQQIIERLKNPTPERRW
jgi:hypothetical protein